MINKLKSKKFKRPFYILLAILIPILFIVSMVMPSTITTSGSGFLSLSSSVTLAVNNPPIGEDTGQLYQIDNEIIEKRTITSKTFSRGNGEWVWKGRIGAIHYKNDPDNEQEQWKDIETSIVVSPKDNWDYEVVKGIWHLLIKDDTTVAIGREGNWIEFRLDGFAYFDNVSKDYEILFTRRSVTPTITDNKIRWENIVPGVNLEYVYTNCRFKENIEITQVARDWLAAHPPSDYDLSNQDSYLGGYIKCDWQNAYTAENEDGSSINWDNAYEFEGQRISFRHPIKDKIITALPLGWASHEDLDPEDWVPIRSRFFKKDGNHWLIFGAKVTSLNSMPTGTITLDPSTDEYPEANSDCCARRLWVNLWMFEADTGVKVGETSVTKKQYGSGMRFVNIAIPKGSTINVGTHITLEARDTDSGDSCRSRIEVEDVDNAPTFVDNSGTFFDRYTNTVGQISWDGIAHWTDGLTYDTPEMQTTIAAIIETRAGWVSGNSIVIFWEDFEERSDTGDKMRVAHSFRSGTAPELTIVYTLGCTEDISNTPGTYDFENVAESSTTSTDINEFRVTNNSGGAIDITVSGTAMTGGTQWTLSDTATPGENIYGLKAGLDDDDDNFDVIVKNTSPNTLVTGLADTATQDWGLQLLAPTLFSDGVEKSGTVTLTATCQ